MKDDNIPDAKDLGKQHELNQLLSTLSLSEEIPVDLYAATAEIIVLLFKKDGDEL